MLLKSRMRGCLLVLEWLTIQNKPSGGIRGNTVMEKVKEPTDSLSRESRVIGEKEFLGNGRALGLAFGIEPLSPVALFEF